MVHQDPILVGMITNSHFINPVDAKQFSKAITDQGIEFVKAKNKGTYDVVIVLNECLLPTRLKTREGFLWKIIQEPLIPGQNAFVTVHPKEFDKVFSHFEDDPDPRIVISPPLLPWFVNQTADQLKSTIIPNKTETISIVASTKSFHKGHDQRLKFVDYAINRIDEIAVFGQGRNHVIDKWDALAPYKYSIAIENSSQPNYWTEKISDCFLSYTVPFYYGDPKIQNYFPDGSYIWLPIDEPEKSIEIIQDVILNDDWEKRIPALEEARNICINKYGQLAYLANLISAEKERLENSKQLRVKIKGKYSKSEFSLRKFLHKL